MSQLPPHRGTQSSDLADVVRLLRDTERVVVLTGAGISRESGVPTFRGPEGLWRNFAPEQLATPAAFRRDPRLVWEWYDWRRGLLARVVPNPGHQALAAMEERFADFTLITQNVDGLHQQAGSRRILEIHGNIWRLRCTGCHREAEDRRVPLPLPPYCQACGALLRPGVVWFGEALDPGLLQEAEAALQRAQVMMMVGTSGVVQPAASFGRWAQQWGAQLVEINPVSTPLTPLCNFILSGRAGEVLPGLLAPLTELIK
jgi:NAD-dependent deacetylase